MSQSLFLAIGLTLSVALIFGEIAERMGEPALLGQIVAGILLGPNIVGVIHIGGEFASLATIGAIILLFDAGYEELELENLIEAGKPAAGIAYLGMITPFAAGMVLGIVMGYDLVATVFVALTLSITSIPVTVGTLIEMDRLNMPYGNKILGAAVFDDVTGILAFTFILVITGFGGSGEAGSFSGTVVKVVGFFVTAYLVYRARHTISGLLSRSDQRTVDFLGIMGIVFLLAYLAEFAGLDAIVGGFAAGLIIGSEPRFNEMEIQEEARGVAYGVFIPIFFAYVGARLDLTALVDYDPMILAIPMVGITAKYLGCYLGNLLSGGTHHESKVIATGMIPHMGVELIIISTALEAGVVGQSIYSGVLAMVMVSVLVTPMLLKRAVHQAEDRQAVPVLE